MTPEDQLDDLVEYWHDRYAGAKTLQEFLGLVGAQVEVIHQILKGRKIVEMTPEELTAKVAEKKTLLEKLTQEFDTTEAEFERLTEKRKNYRNEIQKERLALSDIIRNFCEPFGRHPYPPTIADDTHAHPR
jgi:hypothetical protein